MSSILNNKFTLNINGSTSFDDNINNESSNKRFTNKSSNRIIPLLEHEISHICFNVPNILSNRAAAEYLNVSFKRWKKYASLYINKESNKSYFQLLLDRSNKLKGNRLLRLKELHRKKNWDAWYVNNIINKLNNNDLDIKIYTHKRLKEFLISNNLLLARCACCGYAEKNLVTNKVPLLIDHINNDWKDFKVDNMQLLCFNCFFQLVGSPLKYYRSAKDYE